MQESFQSRSDLCQLSSPSSNSTVRPQRDIYLSNEQPEFPEGAVEQQNAVDTQEFEAVTADQPAEDIKESVKYEAKEEVIPLKVKQSPKQYFHSYGLNKVYSSGKAAQNNNAVNKISEPVLTS